MTLRRIPELDVQLGEILDSGRSRDATVNRIISAVEGERDRPCDDDACARLRWHSRLGPHAWRHEASPPFSHPFPFTWTCFSCGRPTWARIHKVAGVAP